MNLVDEWRQARAGATRTEFEILHPYAFLVSAMRVRPGESQTPVNPKQMDFHTQVHGKTSPTRSLVRSAATGADELLLVALRKATGNPFPDRISIGRAPNCDVVIRDPSVSKLHGHFRDVGPESAVFTDAKSSNGTRVDGVVALPGVAVELRKQGLVTFGRVRLQLLSAADVYDWL